MSHKLLQVAFRWIKTAPDPDKLQAAVNPLCDDWARLNVHIWYLWTTRTPAQVYEGLRTSMTQEDSVVILPVDPSDRGGWASKQIWDWLARIDANIKLEAHRY